MRPAVVTAVLLLVGILNTGTVVHGVSSCDEGWMYVGLGTCMKYITSPKSFSDAEEHCRSLNGELFSIQRRADYLIIVFLDILRAAPQPFWTGSKEDCKEVKFVDEGWQWNSLPCTELKASICIKKA